MKILSKEYWYNILASVIWVSIIAVVILTILSLFLWFTQINNPDPTITSATIAAIGLGGGYLLSHYLEGEAKRKDKRFDQHWELLRAMRFLVLETKIDDAERKKLLNEFQNAYFGSSLFISPPAYNKFKQVVNLLDTFIKSKQEEDRKKFIKSQSEFINHIRKELGTEGVIDFETYDIL